MENAPPPYTPAEFSKTPYPSNPNYCPPAGGAQPPYPPAGAVHQPHPQTQAPYPPTQAPYPPTQGAYPPPHGVYPGYPHAHSTVVVPTQVVVRGGSCPACGVGNVNKELTCCGVLCAIIFFPIGIICCIAMMESKCTNCHAKF